ncbi:MAG: hypothetical protein LBS14_00080 [Holosporaceae bacterium]|jgi:hypothetical protein|nr:hypothetical protein [Holosporaceae bacterium]
MTEQHAFQMVKGDIVFGIFVSVFSISLRSDIFFQRVQTAGHMDAFFNEVVQNTPV